MKIAISASGPDLEAQVEPRFGRAPYFLIVDMNTMEFEAVPNLPSRQAIQGAGIQAAALVARHRPAAVLTGHCGPRAFHNFTDGVIIAGAFLLSLPLGIATGLAVVAHEIPQELGDFAVLLESGYSRGQALFYNTISALATLPGALLGYYFLGHMVAAVPCILLVGAASFLYIALVDLTPYLHRRFGLADSLLQLGLILAGIATIWLLHSGSP